MRLPQLKGTGVALVTPFLDASGKVDFDALERIIEFNIQGGVDYLVSLGTTGEAVTLARKTCKEILAFTLKCAAGRVPVVAGMFGGHWTEGILERIKDYDLEGFAAIMSSNPNYLKPSQEGIFQHFMSIANAAPLPIIIYNVPGRASSNVLPETTLRLANANKKFVAIKEASGDLVQIQKILKHRPKDFMVLSGDDPTALATVGCGGEGVISVIANAYPAAFSSMIKAALQGDYKTAQKLNSTLFDLHQWLYKDGNPAGVKAALHLMGYCQNILKLPLVPASANTIDGLQKEMNKVHQSLNAATVNA